MDLLKIPLDDLSRKLSTDIKKGMTSEQARLLVMEQIYDSSITKNFKNNLAILDYGLESFSMFTLAIICLIFSMIPSSRPEGKYWLDDLFLGILLILYSSFIWITWYYLQKRFVSIERLFNTKLPPMTTVVRDNTETLIESKDIVVGDLVLLKAGDFVSADVRVIETVNLKVRRPLLRKNVEFEDEFLAEIPVEKDNLISYGAFCVKGRGKGIVISNGSATLKAQIKSQKIQLPQGHLGKYHKLVNTLGYFGILLAIILFGCSYLLKLHWSEPIFYFCILLITARPDVLMVVYLLNLVTAFKRLAVKHCHVTNLETIINLGSVKAICCDKTYILTEGTLRIKYLWLYDAVIDAEDIDLHKSIESNISSSSWELFFRAISLSGSTTWDYEKDQCLVHSEKNKFDRVDDAVQKFVTESFVNDVFKKYKKIDEITFTNDNPFSAIVYDLNESRHLMIVKGIFDVVFDFCSHIIVDGETVPITAKIKRECAKIVEEFTLNGLNIIAFCDIELKKLGIPEMPWNNFRFLGLIAFTDPLKPTESENVQKCKEADIRVILVTDDHERAAELIAEQVGIISPKNTDRNEEPDIDSTSVHQLKLRSQPTIILKGNEIKRKSIMEVVNIIESRHEVIFAEFQPSHKLSLVKTLQQSSLPIAIARNLIEEAYALKLADIGVSSAEKSCDFCLECSDVILQGDFLKSFINAVKQSRLVVENINKSTAYFLKCHCTGVISFLIMLLLRIPFLLGCTHLVFFKFMAIRLPAFILSQEIQSNSLKEPKSCKVQAFGKSFLSKVLQASYSQIGLVKILLSLLTYFLVMAENGFHPKLLLGIINRGWYSRCINDQMDSYGQEWTYASRRDLEFTSQTAFFCSLIIIQIFTLTTTSNRIYSIWKQKSLSFYIAFNILVSTAGLCYIPGFDRLHMFPLKLIWWFPSFYFGVVILGFEELRLSLIKYSDPGSWMESETL